MDRLSDISSRRRTRRAGGHRGRATGAHHAHRPAEVPTLSTERGSPEQAHECYQEAISFVNPIAGNRTTSSALQSARVLHSADVPVLKEGGLMCVTVPEEYLKSNRKGYSSPFWIESIMYDEQAATGARA
eukprot:2637798-Pleurochrysis_carterae.AAC.1